jgi:ABC-type Fe3+-siderophore transport system permease subunit
MRLAVGCARPFGLGSVKEGHLRSRRHGMLMRRSLTVLLALAYFVGNGLAMLLMVFFATFPFENQPPDRRPYWLIGVGVAMTVLAFLVLVAVVLRSIWLSVGAFAVDLTVALVLLYWALRESQHSDGTLLLSGFVVELAGLGAVGLAIGPEIVRSAFGSGAKPR